MQHRSRAEQVRELLARLYALSERMTAPSRPVADADRLIAEGEEIATALRRVFR